MYGARAEPTLREVLGEAIVADLRKEADIWNAKLANKDHPDDLRRYYRRMCEGLRQLANRYERWTEDRKQEGVSR